jgi:hypothetical protein
MYYLLKQYIVNLEIFINILSKINISMSASSWNFKDNLTVDNNKFLKFLDPTGVTKNNIIGLNTSSNLYMHSAVGGDIYINSGTNTKSNTFFHTNSIGNAFITTKLAVGITSTANIYSNITLPINSFVGLNTTQGVHNGYLGLAASSSLLNTTGSRIIMYGIDVVPNSGQINLYAGNNTAGHIQLHTGDDSMKMQILHNGTANFQPDGSTIRLSVADSTTTITNPLYITSTAQSTSSNNGALVVYGGVGIKGDTYVDGELSVNSVTGNISFVSSEVSTSYSSGCTYFLGGVGIICSVGASSETAGGALSIAGGLALGKNAMLGGNITVYSTNNSTSALTGSGIFYGGVGINGQVNIRSNSNSQIKLTPVTTGNETSIYFGEQNNYTTSGSWIVGQNTLGVGSGNFAIGSADDGSYIRLINDVIYLDNYTSLLNTLDIYNDNIEDYITFRNTSNTIAWSLGRLLPSNDLHISRFSSGTLLNNLITADIKTGNVNILGTENSQAFDSGGSLTVAGGASFAKDVYIGGNVYGGTITFTGNLQSGTGSDINTFSYLTLTGTDEAVNLTSGALVTFGGITIQCSTDAESTTNGGGLLVAGGASIIKNVYIGETVASNTVTSSNAFITNSTMTNLFSTHITTTNLLSTNITTSNITTTNIRLTAQTFGTITGTNTTTTNLVSTNTSIGTLNNTDIINVNLSSANSVLTNITSTNTILTNISTTNTTITNSVLSSGTITNSITNTSTIGTVLVTSTANLRFNSNTVGSLFTTGGNVGINTTSPETALDVRVAGDVGGLIAQFGSNTGSSIPRIKLYDQVFPGTQGPKIQFDAGNIGIIESTLGRIALVGGSVGINTTTPGYILDVNGTIRSNSTIGIDNTVVNITNSMGAINLSGDIALSNSTRNTIVFSKAGVSPPTMSTRSVGTKLVLFPDVFTTRLEYAIGIETNSVWFSSSGGQFKWYSNKTAANMFLTSDSLGINTNNVAPVYNLDVTGTGRFTSNLLAQFNSNTLGNLYTTGGNVGINNVSPSYTLDVSGTARITSGNFAATFNSNTIGNLFTTGGNVGIQNTSPNQRLEISSIPYSANQDGGIRISTRDYLGLNDASYRYFDIRLKSDVSSNFRTAFIGTLGGGVPTEYEYMSVSQDGYMNVYALSRFENITSCSNSSTGSVVLQGGLSIDCPTNAVNVSNGGALTIAGGAAIAGDLIVGGSISYSNAAAASSTFAYLTLSASDWSTDVANGALVVFGGISVQNTANAYSATEGNGLTVAGGVGIGADLYVGEVGYIPLVISTNNTTTNLVTTNTSSANVYVSNGLRAEFNSNTLGNLYTTGGNVGIGRNNPTYLLDVNGTIRSTNTRGSVVLGTSTDTDRFISALDSSMVENGTVFFTLGQANSNRNQAEFAFTYITTGSTSNRTSIGLHGNPYILNVLGSNNVGINTTAPLATLDVNGTALIRNTADASNSTSAAFVVTGGVSISKTTNATSVTSGGALTIAGGMGVLKDVYVGGTVTSSSDTRLKKNLRPLESILDKIENITPLKYNSIHAFDHNDHIGFIAQDFEEHFPELLMRNSQDAYYSLAYDRITALNMACIKELKNENDNLKKRISDLEKIIFQQL